jgi:hypothetical protein
MNRKPTKAVGWWGKGPTKILGGRDVLGGGTWMGSTKDGSLADVGMPYGYPRISIPGPAHYGGGPAQGLDKMTWRRRKAL